MPNIKWLHTACLLTILLIGLTPGSAKSYEYERYQKNGHVMHVLTLDPSVYRTHIVKAQDKSGRETVPSMAERTHATVAINGGFFKIDTQEKALPTGTLVIKGVVSSVKNKTQALAIIRANKFSVQLANPKQYLHKNSDVSMVSGIPLLVNKGKTVRTLFERKTDFYTQPHARTAMGIKANGMLVIVVSEHDRGIFSRAVNGARGLSIVELAQFMEKQGCQYALNLDGGGSSTLWINGKVVNQTMGDKDESNGLNIVRAVSDAIVFYK